MVLSSDGSPKRPLEDASGPAWGAQSFAANKNNAINKSMKKSGKDPGFGDFGRYFSEKKRKLRDQYQLSTSSFQGFDSALPISINSTSWIFPAVNFQWSFLQAPYSLCMLSGKFTTRTAAPNATVETESNSSVDKKKRLFEGVSIFVDGFTTPTHQELRFLMMNHGGIFENYFSSQRVTHIICSTLPDSKIMNQRLMSRGLPIVKPAWIVDSIKENKLLPWARYQPERIAYFHPNQRKLASLFSVQNLDNNSDVCAKVTEGISQNAVDVETKNLVYLNNELATSATETLGEPGRKVMTIPLQHARSSEDVANVEVPVPPPAPVNNLQGSAEIGPELAFGADGHVIPKEEATNGVAVQKQVIKKPMAGRGHSTLDDPNFVESYFRYSRLHFIGTWRTRYQNFVNAGRFGHQNTSIDALPAVSSTGRPVIIHLDMDCFFVSVVVRNYPALIGKPVAVCHSNSTQGTGEISSANYPARSYGVRAGMFVRDAKICCPELAIVPYDFPAYEEVADVVYSILHSHCVTVQAVSCDEAFLDVTGHPEPENLASRIRQEIFLATRCTASAGIAENLLLARLSTKKAKPNGQYVIQPHEVKEFMATLPLDELPGVGWTLQQKLNGNGLYKCADLHLLSKEDLQEVYGSKTGAMLWSYAQGIDDREVQPAQERKSIGAEVNWGVRFSCMDDAQQFLVTLSNEVASRMQKCSSSGRTITLKIKRRKAGAGEPVKFMGCGICDSRSRSETVGYPTNSPEVLLRISRQLFTSLYLDVKEVRGVGLQVSRLVSTNRGTRKQYNAFESWPALSTKLSAGMEVMNQIAENVQHILPEAQPEQKDIHYNAGPSTSSCNETNSEELRQRQDGNSYSVRQETPDRQPPSDVQKHGHSIRSKSEANTLLEFPRFSQLDFTVLEFLPPDIVAEIFEANTGQEELNNRKLLEREAQVQQVVKSQRSGGGQSHRRKNRCKAKPRNSCLELPPQSQLDPSVLESLPEDIRAEINHAYEQELKQKPSRIQFPSPLPNIPVATSGDFINLKEEISINIGAVVSHDCRSLHGFTQSENIGSIPKSTVDYAPQCGQPTPVKKKVHENYHSFLSDLIGSINVEESCGSLSSNLLSLGSYIPTHDGMFLAPSQHFVTQCVHLLIRHIGAIAHQDLEEVHLILLYLKRLSNKCKLWKAVQERTIAIARDIISEVYGGQLNTY